LPRIVVSKFGDIDEADLAHILKAMNECYTRLEPHPVLIVDLDLFERASQMDAFLIEESSRVGVASDRFDEPFFAMHDAWRGTPRISLCIEKMKDLPGMVSLGAIRHEVGHSVLHGELGYYVFRVPTVYREFVRRLNLPLGFDTNLTYLTSIAVKDMEVTRLLYDRGFVDDQAAFIEHLSTPSEEDRLAWKIAEGNVAAEIMCLTGSIKVPFCASPLLKDERIGARVRQKTRDGVAYLGEKGERVWKVTEEMLLRAGEDTHRNLIIAAELIARHIIERRSDS
jgi:hypothetical protein